jgi:hypothetical protein
VSNQRLLFGGTAGTAIPMGWPQIRNIGLRKKLAGAQLTVSMHKGAVSRFYLGKVFSQQIADFWKGSLSL